MQVQMNNNGRGINGAIGASRNQNPLNYINN